MYPRRAANGSVEITCNSDGKLLMTESVATGTPISEVLERAFSKFGVPQQIITDGGPDFTSKSVSDVLVSFRVSHRAEPNR